MIFYHTLHLHRLHRDLFPVLLTTFTVSFSMFLYFYFYVSNVIFSHIMSIRAISCDQYHIFYTTTFSKFFLLASCYDVIFYHMIMWSHHMIRCLTFSIAILLFSHNFSTFNSFVCMLHLSSVLSYLIVHREMLHHITCFYWKFYCLLYLNHMYQYFDFISDYTLFDVSSCDFFFMWYIFNCFWFVWFNYQSFVISYLIIHHVMSRHMIFPSYDIFYSTNYLFCVLKLFILMSEKTYFYANHIITNKHNNFVWCEKPAQWPSRTNIV